MRNNSLAKERFMEVTFRYKTQTVANWNTVFELAKRIAEAENVGFIIDPDSVETAVKNILGVN